MPMTPAATRTINCFFNGRNREALRATALCCGLQWMSDVGSLLVCHSAQLQLLQKYFGDLHEKQRTIHLTMCAQLQFAERKTRWKILADPPDDAGGLSASAPEAEPVRMQPQKPCFQKMDCLCIGLQKALTRRQHATHVRTTHASASRQRSSPCCEIGQCWAVAKLWQRVMALLCTFLKTHTVQLLTHCLQPAGTSIP